MICRKVMNKMVGREEDRILNSGKIDYMNGCWFCALVYELMAPSVFDQSWSSLVLEVSMLDVSTICSNMNMNWWNGGLRA